MELYELRPKGKGAGAAGDDGAQTQTQTQAQTQKKKARPSRLDAIAEEEEDEDEDENGAEPEQVAAVIKREVWTKPEADDRTWIQNLYRSINTFSRNQRNDGHTPTTQHTRR